MKQKADFLEKIHKIDKSLAKLREKRKITNIRKETRTVTTDPANIDNKGKILTTLHT